MAANPPKLGARNIDRPAATSSREVEYGLELAKFTL